MLRKMNWLFTLIILSSVTASHGGWSRAAAQPTNYVLVWSDEFSTANGTLPDSSKWIMETGGGWSNHELESYTNRAPNAHVQNGNLVITAHKETYKGADGITRQPQDSGIV